jgi:hypothetical protein
MGYAWDGFRMSCSTLDEALDVVDAFRPAARTMLQDWNARLLAEGAATLIDQACVRELPMPTAPLSQTWEKAQDRRLQIIRTERRDPAVDPEFRLTLFRHDGGIYGLDHTEQPEWRDAWRAFPGIADFSWWNGGERPDGISRQEWIRRERAWKAMIPDMWPAGHGVVVILTPRYFDSSPQEVLAAMPSMDDRRRRMAADLALTARMEHIMPDASKDAQALIAAAARASSWIATEEGIAERDRLMLGMSLPDIDLPMLLGFDPEMQKPERQRE